MLRLVADINLACQWQRFHVKGTAAMSLASDAHDAAIAGLIPELDQLAIDAMADWQMPGAALAVVRDGKLALVKAYGQRDLETNLPVTPSTQFLICSITKSFTATAVALLHGEGRLDWTKPVREYIPEFRLHDAVATDRITVLDLLCHRTGLPRHDWVHLPGDRAPGELLAPMRHLEPSRDIRAAWQYNNLCYNVAGLLIERVSGRNYQDFIRSRLTDKLGMTVSFTLEELEASIDSARPYMMHEDERLPALRLPIRTIASGAMNTCVVDLARWMRLHLAKGEYEGERLLSAALIDELHAPRVYYPSQGPADAEFAEGHYGLGFRSAWYRGDRFVWHGGGWIGWGALMTLVPDFGLGVAVLTNRSPSAVPEILTRHIVDRLRGRDRLDWSERRRKWRQETLGEMRTAKEARAKARHMGTRPGHELAAYAGDYENPAYGVMSVRAEAGALHWSWRGMGAIMAHRHYETFELPEIKDRLMPDLLPVTFLTNREGNVVSLSAPLEPMVKDIVFAQLAAGECTNAAFRARCVGRYKSGPTTHNVTLDPDGQLVLKPDNPPAYRLVPLHGRRFRIAELEGHSVEFRGDATLDELIFHQPQGTFVAVREQPA
jgi:CubicO group peptidase (beta-lactamase class C family)